METGQSKNGFTLIELLVVILIIGLTTSLLFVNLSVSNNKASYYDNISQFFSDAKDYSVLKGKTVGVYKTFNSLEAYEVVDGKKFKSLITNKSILNSIDFEDIYFKNLSGKEYVLTKKTYDFPLLIFFPSGLNSGGEFIMNNSGLNTSIKILINGEININEIKQ